MPLVQNISGTKHLKYKTALVQTPPSLPALIPEPQPDRSNRLNRLNRPNGWELGVVSGESGCRKQGRSWYSEP